MMFTFVFILSVINVIICSFCFLVALFFCACVKALKCQNNMKINIWTFERGTVIIVILKAKKLTKRVKF